MTSPGALTVYFYDEYEGRGRRENPSTPTARLLQSKYSGNLEARGLMVRSMAALVGREHFDFITYVLARDSGIEHAASLARGVATLLHLQVISPAECPRAARNKRVLIVDDVFRTGRSVSNLAVDILAAGASSVAALVYLKTRPGAGLPISRPRKK